MSVLEFVKAGGWLMVPIILCSIVAVAICLERLWTLNRSKLAPSNLLATVWNNIQSGKLDAKKAGTPVPDGSVVTACAEACPTHAISFGDLNDKSAGVRAISENNRAYHALEEIGVKPNIFYMTKVRNVEPNQA